MRWVLRLIATGDDDRCLSTDLVEICRPEDLGDIANLGLTLPEAKQVLASVQRAVVYGQLDRHGRLRPCCRCCAEKGCGHYDGGNKLARNNNHATSRIQGGDAAPLYSTHAALARRQGNKKPLEKIPAADSRGDLA